MLSRILSQTKLKQKAKIPTLATRPDYSKAQFKKAKEKFCEIADCSILDF